MTEKPSGSQPKKEKKRLTKKRKQAMLAQARVADPDATLDELAQRAHYNDRAAVQKALQLPHVQDRMRALMDLRPATSLPGLLTKLEEGLEAKTTKFATFEGQITDEKEYDDPSTQARYLEIASGWQGLSEKRIVLSLDAPPPMSLAEARRLVSASPKVIEAEAQ